MLLNNPRGHGTLQLTSLPPPESLLVGILIFTFSNEALCLEKSKQYQWSNFNENVAWRGMESPVMIGATNACSSVMEHEMQAKVKLHH